MKEEIIISNSKILPDGINLDSLEISVDGAEEGYFWFLDEKDNMIKIRFKDTRKVIKFLTNWIDKVEKYKETRNLK